MDTRLKKLSTQVAVKVGLRKTLTEPPQKRSSCQRRNVARRGATNGHKVRCQKSQKFRDGTFAGYQPPTDTTALISECASVMYLFKQMS